MSIIAKKSGTFTPCPAGAWPSVCIDVVDLGEQPNQFRPGTFTARVKVVWQTSATLPDGRYALVSRTYTNSLHEKSTLRPQLTSWRGRDFTPEELDGFDLEKLIGAHCLLNVVHEAGDDGTYANVSAIMRLPLGMMKPVADPSYVRMKDREQQAGQQPQQRQQYNASQSRYGNGQQTAGFVMQQPPAPVAPLAPAPAHQPATGWPPPITDDDVPF